MKKTFVILFLSIMALSTLFACKGKCADEQTMQTLDIQLKKEMFQKDSMTQVQTKFYASYPDSTAPDGLDQKILSMNIVIQNTQNQQAALQKNSKCL